MLTVDALRQHITSPLPDEALQLLLDAAYEAIDKVAGADGAVSELLPVGRGPLLMLSREASAITSVSELGAALETTDYEVRGRQLIRLRTGPHGSSWWRGRWVDVTYTPTVETQLRDSVAIRLINLDIESRPGLQSQSIGSWSESYNANSAWNYARERENILSTLGSPFVMY